MNEVVIVSAVRTPIGRIRGALASVRPDDLAAFVIREAVARAGVDPAEIEEVYLGCANQAGEDNRNIARMALLLAGLPPHVAGVTLNRLCASGLNAVNQAARAILAGEGDIFVAGGVESMTRAPYSLPKNPTGFGPSGNVTAWDTTLGWRYPNPAMEALFPLEAMGETAENIVEMSHRGEIAGGEITRAEPRIALPCRASSAPAMPSIKAILTRNLLASPFPSAAASPCCLRRTNIHASHRLTAATSWRPVWSNLRRCVLRSVPAAA